jgi:predicted transcriptional regulator
MSPKEELGSFVNELKIAIPEGDETFYNIIDTARRLLKLTDKDFRQLFGISQPSLVRWFTRENCPHVAMRSAIYKTFREIGEHVLGEHNGEA